MNRNEIAAQHKQLSRQVRNRTQGMTSEITSLDGSILFSSNHSLSILSAEATQKLLLAFVMSRLDYGNSLLYGCPKYFINRLQKVQKRHLPHLENS